jgi:hypothetical protein
MNNLELIALLQADYEKNGVQEVLLSDMEGGLGSLDVQFANLAAEGGWLKALQQSNYDEACAQFEELENQLANDALIKLMWSELVHDEDGKVDEYWIESYPDAQKYREKMLQPLFEQAKSIIQSYESAKRVVVLKLADNQAEDLEKLREKSMEFCHENGNLTVT